MQMAFKNVLSSCRKRYNEIWKSHFRSSVMKKARFFLLLSAVTTMLLHGCGSGGSGGQEIGAWTDENFPSYIRRLTHFGERADWSHDGQRVLFVEKTFGDVFEIDLTTGIIRPMTHHYFHEGYLRALYLSNRDILL